jgi:hypothetical protein
MLKFGLSCGVVSVALLLGAGAGMAASLATDTALRGQAISQQFLPSGAAIVTTADARACVVSRRIAIETSVYADPDGTRVPFDTIRRSIAASVQAVLLPTGAPGFRVQLKYSPAPGTPILLTLDGRQMDLQDQLEPSADSLWIDGDTATALQAAFSAGERPMLVSTSADTAHLVTDHLDAPDLAALAACQIALAQPVSRGSAVPLTNEIRVTFQADPATSPLATLPELRTCGMTDVPGTLHLARLETVTGFYAQTDKVFVSFDAAGALAQVYIPGIFDADFREGGQRVRLSQASDSNVPTAGNAVKGCLGSATVEVCHYGLAGGEHLLGPCIGSGGPVPLPPETVAMNLDPLGTDPGTNPSPNGGTRGEVIAGFTPSIPGTGGSSGGGPDGGFNPPGGNGGGGDPDPNPSPVPLPASVLLLLGALAGLYTVGTRRI